MLENCMKLLMLVVVLACQAVPPDEDEQQALEDQREAARRQRVELVEQIGRLMTAVRELGSWEEQSGYMANAVQKMFDRNQWNSESDLFALDLVQEVQALPPWAFQERLDVFVGALSDRYLLDERQEQELRHTIVRESNALFVRHAGRIVEYAGEFISTRAAGDAITPEQVAQWVQLATPVFEDSRRSLNEAGQRFMEKLDPEQQAIVQRDIDAANRRMDRVEQLSEHWARGEWQPSDWGMEEDPIQLAGEARNGGQPARADEASAAAERAAGERQHTSPDATRPPPTRPRNPRPTGREPTVSPVREPPATQSQAGHPGKEKDDPWARYVRAFIRKYQLDDGQQQRAWLVYGDVKARADRLHKRHTQQLEVVNRRLGKGDDEKVASTLRSMVKRHNTSMERLFGQLQKRLERLPTSAQRRDALPGELPSPLGPSPDPHPSDGP
jgi:hypothetical protein